MDELVVQIKELNIEVLRVLRHTRRAILLAILIVFTAFGAFLGVLYAQAKDNYHVAKDSKVTADFVRDCLLKYTPKCPVTTTTTRK